MFTIAAYSHADRAPVAITAHVYQDSGMGCSSELLILWTDDADAVMADFDAEERIGAQEEIEKRYWANEQADCALVRVAQQTGDQAFFDARKDTSGVNSSRITRPSWRPPRPCPRMPPSSELRAAPTVLRRA